MGRYYNWDYTKPFYYLVTLKCLPGLPPLSKFDARAPWGIDWRVPLTRELAKTIESFCDRSPGIESVKPYIIMPDHIHVLIKIKDIPNRLSLSKYVAMLKGFLRKCHRRETGIETLLFESEWHDLICKKRGQLGNFIHYVANNAHERLLRISASDKFHCYRNHRHFRLGDLPFDMVGNLEILSKPDIVAVRISRSVIEGTRQWDETMALYDKWKAGMTAVGTWWSKGEQAAGRRILACGGFIIKLAPEGFPARWHPAGEAAQRSCAEGRVLYLSPYPPHSAKLPPGTLRQRCLQLNDLAKQIERRQAQSRFTQPPIE